MMKFQRKNTAKFAPLALLSVLLLSSCKVDMEATLDGSGGGTISTTFTTDMDLLYQQIKAQAEKERAKGVVVETGADGPNRFVRVKGRFARIEELNAPNSDLIWSLQKTNSNQLHLNVRANTSSFPSPVPLSITIHMPGKVLEATAGVSINGRTVKWEGMYASLAGQGLSIRSEVSSFGFPVAIVVMLFLLVVAGASVYLFTSRTVPSRPRSSRFCEECGKALIPGSRFCPECGTRTSS